MLLSSIVQDLSRPLQLLDTPIHAKLEALKDVRAVVFDVYGTLLITPHFSQRCIPTKMDEAFIRQAIKANDIQLILENPIHLSTLFHQHMQAHRDILYSQGFTHPEADIYEIWQDFLDELSAEGLIEGTITPMVIKRIALHYECNAHPVWPMPDALKTIEQILDLNLSISILSNGQFFSPIIFSTLFKNSFEEIGILDKCSVWSYLEKQAKPSSHLYEVCAKRLNNYDSILPKEILYISNDSTQDLPNAAKIGFKTAWMAADGRWAVPETPNSFQPDIVLTALSQLPKCLQ